MTTAVNAASTMSRQSAPAPILTLSLRRGQVLRLLSEDKRRSEIGATLGLTTATVSAYTRQAAYRLRVETTPAALATACADNLVDLPGDRVAVPYDALANVVESPAKPSESGVSYIHAPCTTRRGQWQTVYAVDGIGKTGATFNYPATDGDASTFAAWQCQRQPDKPSRLATHRVGASAAACDACTSCDRFKTGHEPR